MQTLEIVILGWLMILTSSAIVSAAALYSIRSRWHALEERETIVDNAERMERLMDLMQRHRSNLHGEIHRAAVSLVNALENDPMSKEKHFIALQILRSKLAES